MKTSTAQSRKIFHDWLDDHRPWAKCADVYPMMEQIVDAATLAFTGEQRPTAELVRGLETALIRFTSALREHPEGYTGPCACEDCRQDIG